MRIAMATWTGPAMPSSGRHIFPVRHISQNAISSDRERAHDLKSRAIVHGSKQDQDLLRFAMSPQSTCQGPKIGSTRRSAGLCPPRTGPPAKLRVWPAVTAGLLASTIGEPEPYQSRGDTWILVMGGQILSDRNGRGLSGGKRVLLTHISNRSVGHPLVTTSWLTKDIGDLETSLGVANPRAGPQLRAYFCVIPTRTTDQHYTAPPTPGRRDGVT